MKLNLEILFYILRKLIGIRKEHSLKTQNPCGVTWKTRIVPTIRQLWWQSGLRSKLLPGHLTAQFCALTEDSLDMPKNQHQGGADMTVNQYQAVSSESTKLLMNEITQNLEH